MINFLYEVYAIIPPLYYIHIVVGAFLIVFARKDWGLTGLLLAMAAGLFLSIDSEIVPPIYRVEDKRYYIPFIYLATCMVFAIMHFNNRAPKDAINPMGSRGAHMQGLLLCIFAFCHGVAYVSMLNPPISYIGNYASFFAVFLYDFTKVVLMTLQVVVLRKGLKSGINAIRPTLDGFLSPLRGRLSSDKINQGPFK